MDETLSRAQRQQLRTNDRIHSSFGDLPVFVGFEPPSAFSRQRKTVVPHPSSLHRATTTSSVPTKSNLKQVPIPHSRQKTPSFAHLTPKVAFTTTSMPRRAVSVGVTTSGIMQVPSKSFASKMKEMTISESKPLFPTRPNSGGLQRAVSCGGTRKRGLRRQTSSEDGDEIPFPKRRPASRGSILGLEEDKKF